MLALSGAAGAGPIRELDLDELRAGLEGKTLPYIACVQAALPKMSSNGSITMVTAGSAQSALPGTAGLAAVNGALEAAIRPLALHAARTHSHQRRIARRDRHALVGSNRSRAPRGHNTPIQTGLAFLPLPAAVVATAMTGQIVLLKRLGPRPLMTAGMLLGAGGMAWLAQLTPSAGYVGHVLPAVVILGVGMGSMIAPAMFTATYKVPTEDTGVASAMVNTMQQVGGAVDASALTTVFAGAVSSYLHAHAPGPGAIGRLYARLHDCVLGLSGRVRRRRDPRRRVGAQHQGRRSHAPAGRVHRVRTPARAKPRVNPSEPEARESDNAASRQTTIRERWPRFGPEDRRRPNRAA